MQSDNKQTYPPTQAHHALVPLSIVTCGSPDPLNSATPGTPVAKVYILEALTSSIKWI